MQAHFDRCRIGSAPYFDADRDDTLEDHVGSDRLPIRDESALGLPAVAGCQRAERPRLHSKVPEWHRIERISAQIRS